MAGNVEERVVEMRLDNENFESGAKKTISTLEKLEQALHLKSSSKGIDDVQNSVNKFDANPITNGLQKVQASFSALEVVGMRVISNLTDSIYNFTTKTLKEFTIEPVMQGWNKFGDKSTAVATLLAQGYELEHVNELMDDLIWFTDETSYNFVDMVGNIGKFTATGQDLDASVTAMEGIALWAALSGQNATVASRAMMQLSQAMTKHALKYDDWKSIQNANMDTKEFREQAVAAAEAMGVLEKKADGLYEVVGTKKSFGFSELFTSDALTRTAWFSDEVMMKVFNQYSKAASALQKYMNEKGIDTAKEAMESLEEEAQQLIETTKEQTGEVISMDEAYQRLGYDMDEFSMKAFKAGQQARTWKDTVDAIKDAVSTGWMVTFEKLFGDAETATKFYSELVEQLYDIFAEGGNIRNSILGVALDKRGAGWAKFTDKITNAGYSMEQLMDSYNNVVSSLGEETNLPLIESIEQLEAAFKDTSFTGETLDKVIKDMTGSSDQASVAIDSVNKKIGGSMTELRKLAQDLQHGKLGTGQSVYDALGEAGFGGEEGYKMTKWVSGNQRWAPWLSDAEMLKLMQMYHPQWVDDFLKNAGKTEQEIEVIKSELEDVDSLWLDIAEDFGLVTGEAGGAAFREGLLNLVGIFEDVQKALREGFADAFGGSEGDVYIKNIGEAVRDAILRFRDFTEALKPSEDALEGIRNIAGSVVRVFRIFGTIGKGGFRLLGSGILFVKDTLDAILSLFSGDSWKVNDVIDILRERIDGLIPSADDLKTAFSNIGRTLFDLLPSEDSIINFFTNLWTKIKNLPKKLQEIFTSKDFLQYLPTMEGITAAWETFTSLVSEKYPKFTQWLNGFTVFSSLKGIFESTLKGVGNIFNGIKTFLSDQGIDLSGLTEAFSIIGSVFSNLFTSLFGDKEQIVSSINTTIDSINKALKERFSKMSFSDFVSSIKDAGLFVLLTRIIAVFHQFAKGIEEVTWSVGVFLRRKVGKVMTAFAQSLRAASYFILAAAILALAAAIKLLATVPEDKLSNIAVTLGILMLIMAQVVKNFNGGIFNGTGKIFNFKLFGNLASSLIGLAAMLGTLAAVMAIAKNLDMGQLITVFVGIGGLIALMLGLMIAVNTNKLPNGKNSGKNFALTVLSFALALQMLIPVMATIALMKAEDQTPAIMGLIVLMASLGALVIAMDHFVKSGAKLQRVSKSMIGMSAAISLLTPMLIALAIIPPDVFGRAYAGLLGIMAIMGAFTWAISKIKVNGSNFLKVAGGMALLALSLRILMPVIRSFAILITAMALGIPWETFTERLAAFQQALYPFATLATILMGMGLGLAMMGVGVLSFSLGLVAGNLALLLFSASLLLVGKAIEKAGEALPKFVEGLIKAGEMITAENAWNITKGAIAFGVLAIAVGSVAKSFAALFGLGNINRRVRGFGVGLIQGIGSTIGAGWKKIKEALADEKNREMLVGTLAAFLVTVGLTALGVLPTIVELGVNAFITFFNSLADSIAEHEGELADAMSRIAVTLVKVISDTLRKAFSSIFSEDTGFLEKGLFIGGLAALVLPLFSMLTGTFKTVTTVVSGGFHLITGAFKAITGMFAAGGLVSQIGTTLSTLGEAVSIFVSEIGGLAVLGPIAAVLASFGYAVHYANDQVDQYMSDASEGLGDSIDDTVIKVERLQESQQKAQDAFDTAAQYTENLTMEQEELDARTIALNKGYEELASKLGITTQELKNQMDAADGDISKIQALKDAQEELYKTNRPSDWNVPKEAYGPAKVQTDANVPKKSYGPVKQKDETTTNTTIFAEERTLTVTADTSSADASLDAFFNGVEESSSEAESSIGNSWVSTFASIFSGGELSGKVASGTDQIKTILKDNLGSTELGQMIPWDSMFSTMSDVDLTSLFTELGGQMSEGGASIGPEFGSGMAQGIPASEGEVQGAAADLAIIPENTTRDITQTNSPSAVFDSIGRDITAGLAQGITGGSGEVTAAVSELASSIQQAFGDVHGTGGGIDWNSFLGDPSSLNITGMITSIGAQLQTAGTEAGQQLGIGIGAGITANGGVAVAAAANIVQSITSVCIGLRDKFYNFGVQACIGFANGIRSQISSVVSAATAMAKSAEHSITITIKSHSPSKVTTRLGEFFGLGFALGIKNETGTVKSAAEAMGESSINALSTVKSLVANVLEDDFNPVITPVVDMNNVDNAVGIMNGMFNRTYSNKLTARASAISLDVQGIQNGRNPALATQEGSENTTTTVNNLYIDGIKYNTDDYVDSSIKDFVETMVRKQKMYA